MAVETGGEVIGGVYVRLSKHQGFVVGYPDIWNQP